MTPVIALVGRPNVGKSTLFNQMTRSRDALVADFPGLTRDRKYGEGTYEDQRFIVIDTGGLTGIEEGLDVEMARQSLQAIDEADIVLFLVDGRAGLMAGDELIADHLRRSGKKGHLVVNKTDGQDPDIAAADFYSLGFDSIFMIAASHNRGVRSMLELLLPSEEDREEADNANKYPGIRIGIVGRPNVGKSTLVNRMLGEDRVVVYDMPGTTRDSVYIPYERHEKQYTLIDTAGIRRRKNVNEAVEKFSIIKTLKAIDDAHVVILVIDAREGLVDQDLHLIGFVLDAGRSLVVAVNKWDGMDPEERARVKEQVKRRLDFLDYADKHYISALHGSGVGVMYESVEACYESAMAKWPTNRLTTILEDAISQHQPPLVRGRRIKLRYAHQGGSNPPVIVVHGNQTAALPGSYKRYLENTFRKVLKVTGSPIRFEFRSSENPFVGNVDRKTPRQKVKQDNDLKAGRRVKKTRQKSIKR
ncbi:MULTISPECIES: ribosome biogenesis GTPase Der [unclassified Marinobacter]|uniref:ribosome biogenesis GTPase Der n=1 Tax=unclassified Marinobacter TaxID=83889 RepID=UPI0026E3EA3B|nr:MULTISPECIES: ribosome biogenesis GTPase Der [unclassified Marinobacter]MDO6442142.1 ribosome biogenesis GTPase Der [Marinobacter sp. 2_MG-2023]MDO6825092.1 ribosome biogenesis GTPase Der [Marinobacter sp. 1_MG-2023]